jgi:hypothetical protein
MMAVGLPSGNADASGGVRRSLSPPDFEKGIDMKLIKSLTKKFKPADKLSRSAWPLHVI